MKRGLNVETKDWPLPNIHVRRGFGGFEGRGNSLLPPLPSVPPLVVSCVSYSALFPSPATLPPPSLSPPPPDPPPPVVPAVPDDAVPPRVVVDVCCIARVSAWIDDAASALSRLTPARRSAGTSHTGAKLFRDSTCFGRYLLGGMQWMWLPSPVNRLPRSPTRQIDLSACCICTSWIKRNWWLHTLIAPSALLVKIRPMLLSNPAPVIAPEWSKSETKGIHSPVEMFAMSNRPSS